jgi:hypothetical protein
MASKEEREELEEALRRKKANEAARRWREKNKEKARAASLAWNRANPDRVKAANDRYFSTERAKQRTKDYYQENRESERARSDAYKRKQRRDNPEKQRAYNRTSAKRHRAKITRKDAERRCSDPVYRLTKNLRRRLGLLITAAKAKQYRTGGVRGLIGCTLELLRSHLESKFSPEMTWENYGARWHVDHIRPISHFDITSADGARAANHFTNLQPLWAGENLSKGNRRVG